MAPGHVLEKKGNLRETSPHPRDLAENVLKADK